MSFVACDALRVSVFILATGLSLGQIVDEMTCFCRLVNASNTWSGVFPVSSDRVGWVVRYTSATQLVLTSSGVAESIGSDEAGLGPGGHAKSPTRGRVKLPPDRWLAAPNPRY